MNPTIADMIKNSGRSWWQARYLDGKVLNEWETLTDEKKLPVGRGRSSHWELVPKAGMIALRLLCPNGMVGELETPIENKFFQLKVGSVGIPMGAPGGALHNLLAHIIGVVIDAEGNCFCRAWEMREERLIEFYDNVFDMKYQNIGRLSLEVQQLKI